MSAAVVLFDLDGTLIDTRRLYLEAYRRALLPQLGRVLADDEILRARPRSELRFLAAQLADSRDAERALERCIADFNAAYDELHDQLFDGIYVGVPELLDTLRRDRRRIGIVTGKSHRSWETTAVHAPLGSFDVFVFDQDVKEPKPHPEGIGIALERLAADPADAIYVGDTRGDIDAARAAGVIAAAAIWSRPPEWRAEILSYARDAGALVLEKPRDLLRALARPPSSR